MDEIIFLVEESPEGGYEAQALGEAIFTEAETLPELKERIRDAVRCHFDEARRPRIIRAAWQARASLATRAHGCSSGGTPSGTPIPSRPGKRRSLRVGRSIHTA
jgi:hypothetical protein